MEAYREKNRRVLLQGIRTLPRYDAPLSVWAQVESGLDQQIKLQNAIQELPQYAAPDVVWNKIEQSLEQSSGIALPLRHRIGRSYRWTAAAAVGTLVLIAAWLFWPEPAATTTFAHSEEVHAAPPAEIDWAAEDQTINLVLQQVNQSVVTNEVEVNRLKSEFAELTEARTEVEVMLQRYGEAEDLLKEAARIERERSKVIKQLATWI